MPLPFSSFNRCSISKTTNSKAIIAHCCQASISSTLYGLCNNKEMLHCRPSSLLKLSLDRPREAR